LESNGWDLTIDKENATVVLTRFFSENLTIKAKFPSAMENQQENIMETLESVQDTAKTIPGLSKPSEDIPKDEEIHNKDLSPVKNHPLELYLEYLGSKKGMLRGVWKFSCTAGEDNRLYIDAMAVQHHGNDNPEPVPFNELSPEFQDRVYDYMDTLNLDDKLALFAKQYVGHYSNNNQIELVSSIQKLLK